MPLRVGAGVSSYYTEIWPHTRQTGIAFWGDWTLQHLPRPLYGLGVELEGRDIAWGQNYGSGWSFGTLGGGPIYSYRRSKLVQPYAKGLLNYSAQWDMKIANFPAWYRSDKWLTYAVGGGLEVRIHNGLMARADYEYQFWKTNWYSVDNYGQYLNPQGFTLGVVYDLAPQHIKFR